MNNKLLTSHVPQNWIRTRLDCIAEIVLGQSPPSSTYNESGKGLPFYQGKLEFGKVYPIPQKWCTEPKKTAEKGDVLISVRAPVGPTNICPEKSCIGRGLAAVRGLFGIETLFILYLLRANENVLVGKGTGTTFSAISGEQLRSLEIPLPPLNEQRRIVNKVEELFSFLDAGMESLRKVQAQLKRYRQAVLKYAFEGKLTEEWRRVNMDQIQAQPILPENNSELLPLPKTWIWVQLASICREIYRYPTFYGMNHLNSGVPVIRIEHINSNGTLSKDWGSYWFVSDEVSKKFPKTKVEVGDIIMSVRGSIGKIGLADSDHAGAQISPNCLRIAADKAQVVPKFLRYYLISFQGQGKIISLVNSTTISTIKAGLISKATIPLPTYNEQEKIVELVENLFSIREKTETEVTHTLRQSEILRQSILKSAFEGKLIPQDPSDEPAATLLQRITAQTHKLVNNGPKGLMNYVK